MRYINRLFYLLFYLLTTPPLPSLHGERACVKSPLPYTGNSVTATQNIGPVSSSTHPVPLHRSNPSPIHSDLVCCLHNAWLCSVNATHWDTAISQQPNGFQPTLRGMLMNFSAYRSHQSISRAVAVARKNRDLQSGKYGIHYVHYYSGVTIGVSFSFSFCIITTTATVNFQNLSLTVDHSADYSKI